MGAIGALGAIGATGLSAVAISEVGAKADARGPMSSKAALDAILLLVTVVPMSAATTRLLREQSSVWTAPPSRKLLSSASM